MKLEQQISTILHESLPAIIGLPIQDTQFKTAISIENEVISIHLSCGFPLQFLERTLKTTLSEKLQPLAPSFKIEITLDHFIKAHRTQLAGQGLRGVKNTIAIASGKGGVGKSTVTVNLAAALARAGAKIGILDADIYGPSIPLMLGKTEPVQIQDDRYLPVLAHGIQAMSIGYLTEGEPALIWRGPMLAKSLIQMLDITLWDELDYLFIDLPPGTGDIQLSLVQKIPLTGAVVVTTPQNVATLDAEKALKMFNKTNIDVIGIIENMSTHICMSCGHEDPVFGHDGAKKICDAYGAKLLGQMPLNAQIRKECDEGKPTASQPYNELADIWMRVALTMAIELAQKPLNYADKFPPIVVE